MSIPRPSAYQKIRHYNRVAQRNSAAALAVHLIADNSPPQESALLELHRVGMLFLAADAGCYRVSDVRVRDHQNNTIHTPPSWRETPSLMKHFFQELTMQWTSSDALDVAAFTLWRIGWLHPFSDGNGRAATAFAYACLCAKLGAYLDGTNTILDQIAKAPNDCNKILREINLTYTDSISPNLAPLRAYLDVLLLIQVRATQEAASHTHSSTS